MNMIRIPGFTAEASLRKTIAQYRRSDVADNAVSSRGIRPQLMNDTYTTRDVCKACGCAASEVACDCGRSQSKLDCIANGGPSKALAILSATSVGTGFFRGNLTKSYSDSML